jgi:hypothetical protein
VSQPARRAAPEPMTAPADQVVCLAVARSLPVLQWDDDHPRVGCRVARPSGGTPRDVSAIRQHRSSGTGRQSRRRIMLLANQMPVPRQAATPAIWAALHLRRTFVACNRPRRSRSSGRHRPTLQPVPSLGSPAAATISHSHARHPAGSLNPASMRSPFAMRYQPCRDLTEASRFTRAAERAILDAWVRPFLSLS